jgi:hypothetical protein
VLSLPDYSAPSLHYGCPGAKRTGAAAPAPVDADGETA